MKKIFCLILILLTANCAFPAKQEGMTLRNYKAEKQTGDKIFVKESTGGSITLPFWVSRISDDNFTAAVKESLLDSKAFVALSDNWGDAWGLEIEIINADYPLFGMDYSVTTTVKYVLYLKGKKVYQTAVQESGIASFNDEFFAVARLRVANENSAKANIKKFIKELSSQKLGDDKF